MRSMLFPELALVALACLPTGVTQAFDLTDCGVVAIPTDAWHSTRLAAEELTNYVSKVTGVTLQVKVKGEGEQRTDCSVVIGILRELGSGIPEEARTALEATDNFEAAWTGVRNGRLWIVGKDETAELFATYHFLEKHLGVRWLKAPIPGDDGEYVPQLKGVTLPDDYTEFREPRFRVRRLDQSGVYDTPAWPGGVTAVRNGLQICPAYGGEVPYDDPKSDKFKFFAPRVARCIQSLGGGHLTYTGAIPGKTYHKDHPEYFPLVDGKRVRNAQYCLSNPEVARLVSEDVVRRLDRHRGVGYFLFGQVDCRFGMCECENCRALDPVGPDGKRVPSISHRFIAGVNAAARLVYEKYPDADLRVWAYDTYQKFPTGCAIDPRLKIVLCTHGRCFAHAIDDPACARNAGMNRLMSTWAANAHVCNTYEYMTCTPAYYTCREVVEQSDLLAYDRMGIRGWKSEWGLTGSRFIPERTGDALPPPTPHSNWQWIYVTSKLLWEPHLDVRAMLDDIESKYYAEAYPAMKRYHALRRELWVKAKGCLGYPDGDAHEPVVLDEPVAEERLLSFLGEADKLATNGVVKVRLALDRKYLTRYWIKPHNEVREIMKKALTAKRATTPITVDGRADEAVWANAATFEGLKDMMNGKPIPDELQTKMRMLYDDTGLYIFVEARENELPLVLPKGPKPEAWDGDGFEMFLKPPTADNLTYHLAANPDGLVWGVTDRYGRDAAAFGLEARGEVKDGLWTLEIKVPARSLPAPQEGSTWFGHFGRNRRGRKDAAAWWAYTLDGTIYAEAAKYRPIRFEAK